MLHPKLIELEKSFQPSLLSPVHSSILEQKQIKLWIKRDDLIHPVISGNKWRKLKYILDHILKRKIHTIISMGGAFSNHLHALAFVGKQLHLRTVGYIRGERPKKLNPTLQDLQSWGMELKFISRSQYRCLRNYKKSDGFPSIRAGEYWLPEGASTELALQGVAEIISEIELEFDIICVPCGTGTTFAGLIEQIPEHNVAYGFSALKGAGFLTQDIKKLLKKVKQNRANWRVMQEYHFGGFAKSNSELVLFMDNFFSQHHVVLESVYTAKMFYGIFDLIQRGHFNAGQKIVAIHTGGLQGNR